jgi:hypothetical protein
MGSLFYLAHITSHFLQVCPLRKLDWFSELATVKSVHWPTVSYQSQDGKADPTLILFSSEAQFISVDTHSDINMYWSAENTMCATSGY